MIIISRFTSGDQRSVRAKQNIFASAIIKALNSLISFILIPLTLGYLNAYEYGIWLTLSSILSWINSFDIGLGNGLRNKLGIALAEDDLTKGRSYVSTTFVMLCLISALIFVIGLPVINSMDWYAILNVGRETIGNLRQIILASFFFFCTNFIFKFIGNVYQALQLPAVNDLLSFLGHLLSLVVIFIMTRTMPGSLFWVAIVYSAAPLLVYLLCYPITFIYKYPNLAPSVKSFDKNCLHDLLTLSILFFVIQVMGIVLFSLSNLLISNMFGPDQVTPYNIAYRYFWLLPMTFSLFLSPVWSAATDAYAKNDIQWIRKSLNKLRYMLLFVLMIVIVMVLLSDLVYKIWIGTEVEIPFKLSAITGFYVFIILYSLVYSSFLNGMGKIRLQALNICCVAIAFYPICSLLGKQFGVSGIVLGMCMVNIPGAVLNRIQIAKLLDGKAFGLWNK